MANFYFCIGLIVVSCVLLLLGKIRDTSLVLLWLSAGIIYIFLSFDKNTIQQFAVKLTGGPLSIQADIKKLEETKKDIYAKAEEVKKLENELIVLSKELNNLAADTAEMTAEDLGNLKEMGRFDSEITDLDKRLLRRREIIKSLNIDPNKKAKIIKKINKDIEDFLKLHIFDEVYRQIGENKIKQPKQSVQLILGTSPKNLRNFLVRNDLMNEVIEKKVKELEDFVASE